MLSPTIIRTPHLLHVWLNVVLMGQLFLPYTARVRCLLRSFVTWLVSRMCSHTHAKIRMGLSIIGCVKPSPRPNCAMKYSVSWTWLERSARPPTRYSFHSLLTT